jgi:hypothetical protein
MRRWIVVLLASAALAPAGAPLAAQYCAGSAAELQDALTAAAASTADDEVRVVRGFYGPAQPFNYTSTNAGWAFVLGGYDPGCAGRSLDARTTVLDGGLARQVLVMNFFPPGPTSSGPRYGVDNLTIQNGLGTGFTRGGGLAMSSPVTGSGQTEFWLDNLIVRNSSGYFGGGADLYAIRGLIRVANSLFDGNMAPTSAFGHLDAFVTTTEAGNGTGVIVLNSTFVNGTCLGNGGRGCGIGLNLPVGIRGDVVNCVFSNNTGSDVNIESGGSAFINYSSVSGFSGNVVPTVTNPVLGGPGFIDAPGGNFRPRDNSVLLNRGLGLPPFYASNGFDLDGNLRVRSGIPDVGAYENQGVLLINGFE